MKIFSLLLIFLLAPTLGANSLSPMQNVDVFELEYASDPQISPDGDQVVYVRRTMDIMTDSARASIWIIDKDGDNHRPVFSGPASYTNPVWSPEGDRLAYLTSVEGRGTELHVRWMDSGQIALLTNLPSTPRGVTWSPDGKYLAFTAFVKAATPTLAKPPPKPEGANWAPGVVVIDAVNYRSDGKGLTQPGHNHVFVVPAIGGSARQLTSGDYDHRGRLAWSPDGASIVLSANRNENAEYSTRNSDLWQIDVITGEMDQLTERDGPDYSPEYSPDGRKILFRGYDDRKMGYHNTKLYLLDVESGSVDLLATGLDRSVNSAYWAGDSRSIYLVYDDRGKKVLSHMKIGGRPEVLFDHMGGTVIGRPYTSGALSVSPQGSYVVTAGTPYVPSDLAVGKKKKPPVLITELNSDILGQRNLGQVEELTWSSSVDGLEIQGWLVTPPDFDNTQQYPLLLEIHGGPFSAYGPHFSAEVQLFAAAGYVVLYTNPRGSTSYGDEFANKIHLNYPGEDYDDLMSGVDAVISRGFIDKDQLFVTGGSGGGVLTAWIVGKTSRFAAAAVAKPVINWTSQALYSDISQTVPQYWFDKPPWEDQHNYWRRSPLSLVGNVTTPTMLITGEDDQRTPMAETEQYYQALKMRKVDAALVRVQGASHGIASRPSHLIAKVDNILAWFQKYRKE